MPAGIAIMSSLRCPWGPRCAGTTEGTTAAPRLASNWCNAGAACTSSGLRGASGSKLTPPAMT
eukprot:9448081-Lingulodinium_polyedra.AAC.1